MGNGNREMEIGKWKSRNGYRDMVSVERELGKGSGKWKTLCEIGTGKWETGM